MTIKDVAEMANVSKGTVSRVLNGTAGVGDDTRRRVLKLIQTLDFHPDASARGLAARRTNSIGFVIPHTGRFTQTSPFWPLLLTAVTEEAAARGVNVLLSTARAEDDVDSAFRSILRGRRIDGAIIGAEQFGEKQLAELLLKNVPFVTVGRSHHLATFSVDVDNIGGARVAMEYLVARGHRRICVLAGPERVPHVEDRLLGARQVMGERALGVPAVAHCPYDTAEAERVVARVLAADPGLTALLVAAGDLVAGTLRACAAAGRRVPADLSLVSFDDHPFFAYLTPAITAVAQPVEEMGKAAVTMLLELTRGEEPAKRAIVLPPRLVERGSCACLPSAEKENTPRRGEREIGMEETP
jgi:DNA-binding LacI/PurR family transcriptional regulator